MGILALLGAFTHFGFLRQGLRAHVGWKKLRVAFFKAEVSWTLVAEEFLAVADEQLVDADHGGFGRGRVALNLRTGNSGGEAMRLEKWRNPLKAPFEGAHHAILVARGEAGLPLVHPARVPTSQHDPDSSLSAATTQAL